MKHSKRGLALLLGTLLLCGSLSACGTKPAESQTPETPTETELTFVLDWTPNTNHTGLYVAQEKGYFAEEGLRVTVVQPPENDAEALVAAGQAQFGVSFQDTLASALSGESPLPVTAVAAVLQHNTSGILSRKGEGMERPRGLEGHKYATWDLPVEKATIAQVMEKDGGDFSRVTMIPLTVLDEVTTLKSREVDAVWAFYGWGGVACEVAQLPTDYFAFSDLDPVFDFYTPVIIAGNDFLAREPETARRFLRALSRGYADAAEDPQGAAEILMQAVPELADSRPLVEASQSYLSGQYLAGAPRWGVFDAARWSAYYDWLKEKALVPDNLDPQGGFSNEYLPE